jgi:hypothetical protein
MCHKSSKRRDEIDALDPYRLLQLEQGAIKAGAGRPKGFSLDRDPLRLTMVAELR